MARFSTICVLALVACVAFLACSTVEGVHLRKVHHRSTGGPAAAAPATSAPSSAAPASPAANAAKIAALEKIVAANTAAVAKQRYNVRAGMTDPNAPKATRGRFTKKTAAVVPPAPVPAPAPVKAPATPAPVPAPAAPVTPAAPATPKPVVADLGAPNSGAMCDTDKDCHGGLTCEYVLSGYSKYCAQHFYGYNAPCATNQSYRCPTGTTCRREHPTWGDYYCLPPVAPAATF